ncbi:hypothetical protein CBM2595_P390029 [Cupriavidus taiwanensis]|nr:hypothetical protein CBM2595_P390029 [Cupriavidus taiwanensis]
MNQISETAYPLLPAEIAADELRAVFTPSAAEIRFVYGQFRQAPTRVLILTQLKLLQRLGYMPPMSDVPPEIVDHICSVLKVRSPPRATIKRYDRSGSKSRHQKVLREFVGIRVVDALTHEWLAVVADIAARTKAELPDIVNVLLEELIRQRYELPPLATLSQHCCFRPQPASRGHLPGLLGGAGRAAQSPPRRSLHQPGGTHALGRTEAGTKTAKAARGGKLPQAHPGHNRVGRRLAAPAGHSFSPQAHAARPGSTSPRHP